MNYNEALDFIHSLGRFSLPAGLERIKTVLNALGNPQTRFKAIHIAGTNGKGSVSSMISSVFNEAGYKTGLFISPYIINFRERIQICGEYISEENLIKYAELVKKTNIQLNEFEFITAMAFLYFAEQNCDIVVCETGLGGRFDATNALEEKVACVLTKIGLDHTEILGDTIEKIALEKCGILRNCPTVTNPCQTKSVFEVIKSNAPNLIVPDLNKLQIINKDDLGNSFIYKGNEYKLSLCGDYQIENALTAIEAINVAGYNISYTYIYKGLEKAHIPARMEMVSNNPLIIVDGAHNPDGAQALSKELEKYSGKAVALIGMMKDKDSENFLKITLKHCKTAVAVKVLSNPRSMTSAELKVKAEKYCKCYEAADYASAIAKSVELANGSPIFVFGSLYLAADIRSQIL